MSCRLRIFILTFFSCFAGIALAALPQPVKTHSGQLQGSTDASGLSVFRGIPYAAAPVGENRWREPQNLPSWSGIRSAREFAPRCIQRGFEPGADQDLSSEDCLYLNVWTPADTGNEKLPVLLWIHGGGYFGGAGSTPTYDGAKLASKGAVVVTINYRLGVFGFFAHPELTAESPHHSSGNVALLDMISALQWVQNNIDAFGGNPDNITLMGESAGGNAVANLIASPLTAGLFQRAILQSGGWLGWLQMNTTAMPTLAQRESTGMQQAAAFGTSSIKELRKASTETIFKNFPADAAVNVDGYLLPADTSILLATGQHQAVDILAGSNQNEAVFFGPGIAKADEFRQLVSAKYGSRNTKFLKLYPAESDAGANASYLQAHTNHLAWQMRKLAQLQLIQSKQAWIYFFTRVPPGQEARGATHVAELPYMFNHAELNPDWTELDKKLSDTMSAYWVNFARTGNPNASGMPNWPAYRNNKAGNALVLGASIVTETVQEPAAAALQLFDEDFALFTEQAP